MSGPFTKSILSWGRAVKSWATGLDYVNTKFGDHPPSAPIPPDAPWALPAMSPVPVPPPAGTSDPVAIPNAVALTTPQFVQLMEALKIDDAQIPASVKRIIIVQADEETWIFRLPPKVHLQESEEELKVADYSVPSFYDELYSPPKPGGAYKDPSVNRYPIPPGPERFRLHANRIGEYTLNNCM